MKTTLVVSSRGVVTLPAKFRAALGIAPDDHVIAETTSEGILLRPAVTLPIEMYSAARIEEFDQAEADLAAAAANALAAPVKLVGRSAKQLARNKPAPKKPIAKKNARSH